MPGCRPDPHRFQHRNRRAGLSQPIRARGADHAGTNHSCLGHLLPCGSRWIINLAFGGVPHGVESVASISRGSAGLTRNQQTVEVPPGDRFVQRTWRNVHAIRARAGNSPDCVAAVLGRSVPGLPPTDIQF